MSQHWISGNRVELLENGDQFFPRVFGAISEAQDEIIIETFILFEDKVGLQLQAALCSASLRGVKVDLMIDGFGSAELSDAFVQELTSAGVCVRVFDPGHTLFGQRLNLFRRMHRKLVVIDGLLAFIGGINYIADQLLDFGPQAKQDYAIEVAGPIVSQIHGFMLHAVADAVGGEDQRWLKRRFQSARIQDNSSAGGAEVQFLTRDNGHHTNDIERHYRAAIRSARHQVIIANAYFFPGYRLIKEMRRAARRGVDVRLILQGEPDMAIVKIGASMLYHHLLNAGVKIYEYCERPLHGKVAVVDDRWSTVGSSNLDPLSLSLNLEANVVVRDQAFNQNLSKRLHSMSLGCKEIKSSDLTEWSGWRLVRSFFIFHLLRWYPSWAAWLPRHAPQLRPLGVSQKDRDNWSKEKQ